MTTSSPIKVLVFSHACLKRVNRFVFEELKSLGQYDIQIVAPVDFVVEGGIQTPDPVQEGDLPVIFNKLVKTNPRVYKFEDTIDLLNTNKPDVIYLDNDPVSMQALQIGRWATKNNSELICLSCENLSFGLSASIKRLGFRGIPTSLFKLGLSNLTKKHVSHVFAINNEGNGIFSNLGYKSVSTCVLGFNPKIFYPNEDKRLKIRQRLSVPEDQILFAYVGRLVFEKGVHLLIDCLSELKKYSHWSLMLDQFTDVRTPYQDEVLAAIKSNGLEDRVQYFEASHAEIPDYMNAADVVVLPSISTKRWVEQYGRVVPEALACGKLVVASNSGALPMLLKTHGILFEEGDRASLTEVLEDILNNPNRIRSIQPDASTYAHNDLSIMTQANQIREIINQLIPNH